MYKIPVNTNISSSNNDQPIKNEETNVSPKLNRYISVSENNIITSSLY